MRNENNTLEERVTNQVTTFTNKIFTLKTRDFLKGLLMAVVSPVFTVIITSVSAKELTFDWYGIRLTALSSFLAYIAKNFFEKTKTVIIVDPAIKGVSTEETKTTIKN